jgi:hypothetical protein
VSEHATEPTGSPVPADEPAAPVQFAAEPPAALPPLATPTAPVTGEPAVDAAVDNLSALSDLPVSDHVAIFEETHRQLQDALADLDEG